MFSDFTLSTSEFVTIKSTQTAEGVKKHRVVRPREHVSSKSQRMVGLRSFFTLCPVMVEQE